MVNNTSPTFIKFNDEILKSAPLSHVRALARAFGDSSPTTKSVAVLKEFILSAQNAGVKPSIGKNKYGAPSKWVDLSAYYIENYTEHLDGYTKPSNSIVSTKFDFSETDYKVTGVYSQKGIDNGVLMDVVSSIDAGEVAVPFKMINRFGLVDGDIVSGVARRLKEDAPLSLVDVVTVNGTKPVSELESFENLTPCHPDKILRLEGQNKELSNRIIDLFAPIGKGQRALIVASPKSGKTTILKNIALGIEENNPEVSVMVLLIDERPEDVTEFKSSVTSPVYYTTFDEEPSSHMAVAHGVLRRAKTMVESGKDVVILMDSITKLARAYNLSAEARTLSLDVDPSAVMMTKKFFGSARNVLGGGSLTIISTALVETGNRIDEFIYEEFKSAGNMELYLDGELAKNWVFPAIDILKSNTRKADLLLSGEEVSFANKVRRLLSSGKRSIEDIITAMEKAQDNADFMKNADNLI